MPIALPQPFLRAEALSAGVSERRLDGMLDRGVVTRVASGVYALTTEWKASPPWDRHLGLARAAVRATPDAIISHVSAAALLHLPMPPTPPQRATMTVLHDSRTSVDDGWRQFHRGQTPPSHIVIDRGHPYLVPARTVIDCMRELRPGDALAVLDAALRRRLVTGPQLLDMRRHQRRWPGIRAADRILQLGDGLRESWFESSSAWMMADWGLPLSIPQVVITDSRGRFVGRVDALWPELGVVGEADGRGKYLLDTATDRPPELVAARAVLAQAHREARLRDLGLEVLRWDPVDLRAPLGVVERFHAAAERAGPQRVTARYMCFCCRRPLTDCEMPTRIRGVRTCGGG